jgi:GNAT superfamily N-acetyltransferase
MAKYAHHAPVARPDDLAIRLAVPDDGDVVHLLMTELATEDGGVEHVLVTPSRWRELLARPDVMVVLAELDGTPAGYVSATRRLNLWLGRDLLAVDDVFVRPHARNAGVGALMMRALARIAATEEVPPVIRWELREDNEAAARFYSRLGARLRTKQIAAWLPEDYAPASLALPGGGVG